MIPDTKSVGPARTLAWRALEFIAVALAYFALARGSLLFASLNPSASPVWPPTGFALAVVLLRGTGALPAILAGAFVANVTTAGSLGASGLIAIGNMSEAFAGAYLLRHWAGGRAAFHSPGGVARFASIVIFVAAPISATVGVLSLGLFGLAPWNNFIPLWSTWWLGDLAGAVLLAPAIVLGVLAFRDPLERKLGVEHFAVAASAIAIGLLAFSPLSPASPQVQNAMAFTAILPILWAALRLGSRDVAVVAMLTSAIAIWGAQEGVGPFVQGTLNETFLLLVAFVVSATLPSLALSAAITTRDRSINRQADDYRRLVDSVPDYAILMLDPEGRVSSWNAGAGRLTRYKEAEILGRHFACFHTEEDQKTGEPEKSLAIARAIGHFERECWQVRRDGSHFWGSLALNAVRDPAGNLAGFAKITRDLTERREADEALNKAREELAQAQKMEALGQLTGGIAHDFNNLLMSISGGISLLARRPERIEIILQSLRETVERGAGITRQLLAFARREPARPEVVDSGAALSAVRNMLAQSLGERFRIDMQLADHPWSIDVDRAQFELAILNLAINARDAMPDGGTVTLSAENIAADEGQFVRLVVGDTGAGMSAEIAARAFEPFFSTKAPGRGTGLGLSQVYGFVRQSGGSVTIDSVSGRGTRVVILLPRAHRAAPTVPAGGDTESGAFSARVLIVEDNDGVAAAVSEMIADLGHHPRRVANADEALNVFDTEAFDIVFSDIVMPGMGGIELAREIRRRRPDFPVLLTTGCADATVTTAEPVLRKPYQSHQLQQALHAALAARTSISRSSETVRAPA